ncbi:hypothetical protein [Schleiferilactobacillus shenzhenensis]|uniref:Uncharacterized protein n=1 Tax=Schleiferilactobacillus shenzhenensis LY-73 TaxID=1231336 RepID=U4TQ89_9LACO|nr:hypothetical protein [Schleiferilactobacillus shenzhenensis]ERL64068.1 hypothetical protein L248_1601 [Schleiferilactobacillus shenzhenensis LY-73]
MPKSPDPVKTSLQSVLVHAGISKRRLRFVHDAGHVFILIAIHHDDAWAKDNVTIMQAVLNQIGTLGLKFSFSPVLTPRGKVVSLQIALADDEYQKWTDF